MHLSKCWRGTCSSFGMLKGYMVKERLGTPGLVYHIICQTSEPSAEVNKIQKKTRETLQLTAKFLYTGKGFLRFCELLSHASTMLGQVSVACGEQCLEFNDQNILDKNKTRAESCFRKDVMLNEAFFAETHVNCVKCYYSNSHAYCN